MFNFKKTPVEPTHLQKVIDDLLTKLDTTDPSTKEYAAIADQVAKLYEKQKIDAKPRISPDAWLAAGVSVLTVVIILNAERVGPITSKALSFIPKSVR